MGVSDEPGTPERQTWPDSGAPCSRAARHPASPPPLPTPYNRHPTPHTLHTAPYTLHPTPYTLHPTHYNHTTPHPQPHTAHHPPPLPQQPWNWSSKGLAGSSAVERLATADCSRTRVEGVGCRVCCATTSSVTAVDRLATAQGNAAGLPVEHWPVAVLFAIFLWCFIFYDAGITPAPAASIVLPGPVRRVRAMPRERHVAGAILVGWCPNERYACAGVPRR